MPRWDTIARSAVKPYFRPTPWQAAGAKLGSAVFLGSHAVVTPNVEVGANCKIAAAAVVYHPVPEGCLVAGNPAKATPLKTTSKRPGQKELADV